MANIFHNASLNLQGSISTPRQPYSNMGRSRLPLSQARHLRFGDSSQPETATTPRKVLNISPLKSPLGAAKPRNGHIPHITSYTASELPFAGADGDHNESLTRLSKQSPRAPIELQSGSTFPPQKLADNSDMSPERMGPVNGDVGSVSARCVHLVKDSSEANYPDLDHWRLSRSGSTASSASSDSGRPSRSEVESPCLRPDAHQTKSSDIESWLNDIPGLATCTLSAISQPRVIGKHQACEDNISLSPMALSAKSMHISSPKSRSKTQKKQRPPSISSNKENVSPKKGRPLSISPVRQYLHNSSSRIHALSRRTLWQSPDKISLDLSLTSQGHSMLPPKRIKICSNQDQAAGLKTPKKDFTIHDDQLADALAQLSPDVERHRKGRGPKRERCNSYWDHDILHSESPPMRTEIGNESVPMKKGKKVLGESELTAELTQEEPFAEEARNAAFDFHV